MFKFIIYIIKNKSIEKAHYKFIEYNKYKNLSEKTIAIYKERYKYFIKFFPKKKRCYMITEKTIKDYIVYMRNTLKVNDATINTRLRALRTFVNFCASKNYMKKLEIHLVKERNKKDLIPYSDEDIEKLLTPPNLEGLSFKEAFSTFRNWTISCYLHNTGNRLRTILNIKIDDVNLGDKTVYLRAMKNSQPQTFPLSDNLTIVLESYMKVRKQLEGEYLFCTYEGKQLKQSSMLHAIYRYNRRLGVNKTSIHLHRYKFAIDFSLSGGNAFELQRLLNHATLQMSYHYTRINATDLRGKLNKSQKNEKIDNIVLQNLGIS